MPEIKMRSKKDNGVCASCIRPIRLGEDIIWDTDERLARHARCGDEITLPPDTLIRVLERRFVRNGGTWLPYTNGAAVVILATGAYKDAMVEFGAILGKRCKQGFRYKWDFAVTGRERGKMVGEDNRGNRSEVIIELASAPVGKFKPDRIVQAVLDGDRNARRKSVWATGSGRR